MSSEKIIKECWIHVGMHKTGTTSVQQTLSEVSQIPGWHYLRLDDYINLGVPLHAMFASNPSSYHWFRKRGQDNLVIAELAKRWKSKLIWKIKSKRPLKLLISAEGASLIDEAGIERMKAFLDPYVESFKVIGFVRPPMSFASSMFQQHIKFGRKRFDLDGIDPKYRFRFEKFDRVFGPENVKLLKFDPSRFGDCFVRYFCAQIGLDLPESVTVKRSNESMTRYGAAMLYSYYKLGPGYGQGPTVVRENRALIGAMFLIEGPKFKLSDKLVLAQSASFAEDIQWMEKRLGESLSESSKTSADDILGEEDFLRVPTEYMQKFVRAFSTHTGLDVPDHLASQFPATPQGVADLLQACRHRFRKSMQRAQAKKPVPPISPTTTQELSSMKLKDLVEAVKAENPETLGKMPVKKAMLVAKKVLEKVGKAVEEAPEAGVVKLAPLGTFHVKAIAKEQEGKKAAGRILFNRNQPKAKKKAAPAKG